MSDNEERLREALEPCPFCGGEAKRLTLEEEGPNFGGDVIVCTGVCGASSHVEFGRKENLVSLWNRRTLPQVGEKPVGVEARIGGGIVFYERGGWCTRVEGQPFPPTADAYTYVPLSDDQVRALATLSPPPRDAEEPWPLKFSPNEHAGEAFSTWWNWYARTYPNSTADMRETAFKAGFEAGKVKAEQHPRDAMREALEVERKFYQQRLDISLSPEDAALWAEGLFRIDNALLERQS